MNRDAVKAEVKDIFHHIAPDIEFDELDLSRPLRDQVEIDSLDFYNVLVQIHKRLGVNVPDSVLLELNNLDGLLDFICTAKA
jgi:acyl carrier protein